MEGVELDFGTDALTATCQPRTGAQSAVPVACAPFWKNVLLETMVMKFPLPNKVSKVVIDET